MNFDFNKKHCYRNGDAVQELLRSADSLTPIISRDCIGSIHMHNFEGAEIYSSDYDLLEVSRWAALVKGDLVVVWGRDKKKSIEIFESVDTSCIVSKIVTKNVCDGSESEWLFGMALEAYNTRPLPNIGNAQRWDNVKPNTPVMVWLEGELPVLQLFHSFDKHEETVLTQTFRSPILTTWDFGELLEYFDFNSIDWNY